MRPMFFLLLLATGAAPAFAGPDDQEQERRERAEMRAAIRAERAESRPARIERMEQRLQHVARPEPAHGVSKRMGSSIRTERADRTERVERASEQRDPLRWRVPGERHAQQATEVSAEDDAGSTWRPQQRREERATARSWAQQPRDGDIADRRLRRVLERHPHDRDERVSDRPVQDGGWSRNVREPLAVSTVPRAGTQPPLRVGGQPRNWSSEWSRDWRDDRRYDWRHHRNQNRSLFHIGYYYDPFGWNYRRYNIGWRMWPSYYGRSYWLHDPLMYRLPPAYPGTRWIRYHGDAILIDTWTGEVVDVIHDFFW